MGEQTSLTPDFQEENSEQQVETQETMEQQEVQDVQEQSDTVPLATYLDMKNKFKDAKTRLAEIEDSKRSEDTIATRNRIKNKWIDKGFDEDTANAISEEIAGVYEELGKAKQSKADILITEEIDELSSDSFYSDIKQYEGQIKSKIKQFKKVGEKISVEDAYLMVAGVRTKLKESQLRNEVVGGIENANKAQSNVPTAVGSKPQNVYNLDSDDRAALAQLKVMQPTANWDEKKYYEMVKKR